MNALLRLIPVATAEMFSRGNESFLTKHHHPFTSRAEAALSPVRSLVLALHCAHPVAIAVPIEIRIPRGARVYSGLRIEHFCKTALQGDT